MSIALKSKKLTTVVEKLKVEKQVDKDKLLVKEAAKVFAPLQKSLGLGAPAGSGSKSTLISTTTQLKKLAEKFRCVEVPEASDNFLIAQNAYGSSTEIHVSRQAKVKSDKDVRKWTKPKLVMTKLSSSLIGVTLHVSISWKTTTSATFTRSTSRAFRTRIPVMPKAVLDKATEAKSICPSGEFFLIWEAEWANVPQRDPVLLMKVNQEYFEVAHWDGDVDLIREYLIYKEEALK
jgi:hypothetical protein